jgi:ATP synthase protein I
MARSVAAENQEDTTDFKRWSRTEAQVWRKQNPAVSPWYIVAAQILAGLICCAVAGLVMQRGSAVLSALYGALVVVVPSSLLVRGLGGSSNNPLVSVSKFMLWSVVKLCLAAAMLVVAVKVVPNLNWVILLITVFVCIKVNWVALLWRARRVD